MRVPSTWCGRLAVVWLGTMMMCACLRDLCCDNIRSTTTVDAFVVVPTAKVALPAAAANQMLRRMPARSRRFQSPPLWNKNADEEDNTDTSSSSSSSSSSGGTMELFESLVQQVTGDETYHFGDLTKQALSDLTGKNVTADGYQFGDISKNVATTVGQSITGDEDYEFGDITKGSLRKIEQDLEEWKTENLSELPNSIFQQTLEGLSPVQRRELIVAFVRLGAIGLLAWGVVANLCTAGVLSLAWMQTVGSTATATVPTMPILPLWTRVDPVVWKSFLMQYTSLRLVLDPFLLVVKAAGTLFMFLPYVRCIGEIERRIPKPWRSRAPLICRGMALATAFTVNNLVLSGIIGSIFLGAGGLAARIFLVR